MIKRCFDPGPPHSHSGRVVCYTCGCPPRGGDRLMHKHRKERIFIGPRSAEIIVNLRRPHGAGFYEDTNVSLRIHRHRCGEQPVAELKPYAVDKTSFFFPIDGEFFTDTEKFPKGFYIGDVVIDDCVVDTIEIVKSPGIYAAQALTTRDMCFERKVYKDTFCPTEDCVEIEKKRRKKREKPSKPCRPKIIVEGKVNKENYLPDISGLMEDTNE